MSRTANLRAASAMLAAVAACGIGSARADTADAAAPAPAAVQHARPADRAAVLLVVAPRALAASMGPLVAHKTKTGMPARLVVIESLDPGSGRDDAERVKRAIFDSHEKHGTRYVILAGDASLFPVRLRSVCAPTNTDCAYEPTELYYASLYEGHEPAKDARDPAAIVDSGKFDDWDADGDGEFDTQYGDDGSASFNPDSVDGCPDVAVGRLPAHTPEEATAYVDKVIRYETEGYHRKLEKLALFADHDCPGAEGLCDIVAGAAQARRYLVNCSADCDAQAPWKKGTFSWMHIEVMCSGWIVYVGNAASRSWEVHQEGHDFDAGLVAEFKGGDPLRGAVFSVGGETGRFVGRRIDVARQGCYEPSDARHLTFACSWLTASGGAIVFAGENLKCPSDTGAELVRDVLAGRSGRPAIFGDLWIAGQRRYWLDNHASEGVFRSPRIYLGIMTLFGDPSLRVPGCDNSPR